MKKSVLPGNHLLSGISAFILLVFFTHSGMAGTPGPMKGVTVSLTDAHGNVIKKGVTNDMGLVHFSTIPIGDHTLHVYTSLPLEGARVYALDDDMVIRIDHSGKVPGEKFTELKKVTKSEWTTIISVKGAGRSTTGSYHCKIVNDCTIVQGPALSPRGK